MSPLNWNTNKYKDREVKLKSFFIKNLSQIDNFGEEQTVVFPDQELQLNFIFRDLDYSKDYYKHQLSVYFHTKD